MLEFVNKMEHLTTMALLMDINKQKKTQFISSLNITVLMNPASVSTLLFSNSPPPKKKKLTSYQLIKCQNSFVLFFCQLYVKRSLFKVEKDARTRRKYVDKKISYYMQSTQCRGGGVIIDYMSRRTEISENL